MDAPRCSNRTVLRTVEATENTAWASSPRLSLVSARRITIMTLECTACQTPLIRDPGVVDTRPADYFGGGMRSKMVSAKP